MKMANIKEAYTARKEQQEYERQLQRELDRGSYVYGLDDLDVEHKRQAVIAHLDRIDELEKKIYDRQAIIDNVLFWSLTKADSVINKIVELRVLRLADWSEISREVLQTDVANTSQMRLKRFMEADELDSGE